jgi:pimeloyl-ACP methyl ester carboxylesterase
MMVALRATTAALSIALGCLAMATAHAASIPVGPGGDAFYTPPSPLPKGPRGSVIWMRPLDGTMALPGAAQNSLVLYRSIGPKGESIPVSGTVSLPHGEPPRGGWPVIVWTHGTTGLAAACAPSRDTDAGPEHAYIAVIRTLLDSFVKKGYVVVATDYEGLGVAGSHPFLQGVPTGRTALDMLRAVREIEPKIGKRYAVMGHSQGGQVDLFAASLGPAYVPEFRLVGNVAFAPGSHIGGRLKAVMDSPKNELALPYVLYTLGSYAHTNKRIDLRKILTPEALSHVPDLLEGCMTHALSSGYWSTAIAKDQFVARPRIRSFLEMARRNEPGRVHINAPTMIVQGMSDVTVLPKDTDKVAKQLCLRGDQLDYKPVAGADHDGSMEKGGSDALAWIDARFRGEKMKGNCAALPRAGG